MICCLLPFRQVKFITDVTTNAAYKVKGDATDKQQRRHKWTESTEAILGQLKLKKGSGAITHLHDDIFTPGVSAVKTFLKAKSASFDMWDVKAPATIGLTDFRRLAGWPAIWEGGFPGREKCKRCSFERLCRRLEPLR